MDAAVPIHVAASLIGDSTRAAMLAGLLSGQALTAGELALLAGVSPQNASGHLNKLLSGKLVRSECYGRYRYYSLHNANVAQVLEGLAGLSSSAPAFESKKSRLLTEISFARSCYDHLAGKLAIGITSSLLQRRFLAESDRDFVVTTAGGRFFDALAIDLDEVSASRRALARKCMDWTERRPHIAGALGAALLARFKDLKWIAGIRDSRALRVTIEGQRHLREHFAIELFR